MRFTKHLMEFNENPKRGHLSENSVKLAYKVKWHVLSAIYKFKWEFESYGCLL